MAPQITLTFDLTPETLEILKLLTSASTVKTGGATPEAEQLTFDDLDTGKDKKPAKKSTGKDKKAATPKEAPDEPAETPDTPETESEDDAPAIKMTDVRAVALKLSKAGKQAKLKEIFAKYGAAKLSDISEEHYADLMADLEAADE